jgi:hypothetical protein
MRRELREPGRHRAGPYHLPSSPLDRRPSRSLVIAGVCLAGLGVLTHQVNEGPSTSSPSTSSGAVPFTAPAPLVVDRPSALARPSPNGESQPLRQVVVVPRSACHRFVETLGGSPAQTITVQNSCQ